MEAFVTGKKMFSTWARTYSLVLETRFNIVTGFKEGHS